MDNIGKRIKAARKKAGLTQKELGLKMGISQSAIGQFEKSGANPKIETLIGIAKALGQKLTFAWPSGEVLFYSHALCWDEPCFKGYPICCYDCEEYEDCPEACDTADSCRKDEDND